MPLHMFDPDGPSASMGAARHLIFSTNKPALAGYAQTLRGQPDVQVELFHYSEQDGLDADALEAQVSSASEASVLLLATAASSYLWFDPEHYPINVELCTRLKKFPEVRANFVVCPTTDSARDGWQQHSSDLQSVFGDFLPETGKVDTWTDFDPEHDLEQEQIRSLVCRNRSSQGLKSDDVIQQSGSGYFWRLALFVNLLVLALGSSKLYLLSSQLEDSTKTLERVEVERNRCEELRVNETRDHSHHIQLIETKVELCDAQIQCSHGQSLQWEWFQGTCSTLASQLASSLSLPLASFDIHPLTHLRH